MKGGRKLLWGAVRENFSQEVTLIWPLEHKKACKEAHSE